MLVVSASARTLAPSSPTLLTMNVQHRQIQHTKAEKKNTLKVQRRERRVGLECISEGIGTVSSDGRHLQISATATSPHHPAPHRTMSLKFRDI